MLQSNQNVTRETQEMGTGTLGEDNNTLAAGFHTKLIPNDWDVISNYE